MKLFIALVLFASTLCGCTSDADFAVKYASDFRRDGRTVSVFGVYKDGRMSADTWTDLAPRFAGALGGTCEAAYRDEIVMNDRALASAIDDQARSDGVTEPLLDLFAPQTASDAIVLVTVAGRLPTELALGAKGTQGTSPPPGSAPPPSGKGGRHGGAPVVDPSSRHKTRDVLEIAASLYSVRDHRTVAVVMMTYSGKSTDEAFRLFADKLKAEIPGMQCGPWKRDVKVEADAVRAVRPSE